MKSYPIAIDYKLFKIVRKMAEKENKTFKEITSRLIKKGLQDERNLRIMNRLNKKVEESYKLN